jgi:hypothetical protein
MYFVFCRLYPFFLQPQRQCLAPTHGLIICIDTKAKFRHLKKLTYTGTLWQVFIRVYRLEIQSVMLVFATQPCPFTGKFF